MARKPTQTQKPAAEDKAAVTPEGAEEAAVAATTETAQDNVVSTPDAGTVVEAVHDPEGAEADLAIVCHRKDGRRRAGQKWPFGETRVSQENFSAYQLAQLRGDPAFTVFHIEKG